MTAWEKFCDFLLCKVMGWTVDEDSVPEDKCILLGVPHTSIWDFVVSYLYYRSRGEKGKCMIKKELFFPPLGWILKAMGGVPVDRSNPTNLVRSVIQQMEAPGRFHLAIAPEGTRKPVKNWKTGFHFIARSANIPVYLGYFDWGTKHIGRGRRFELSDDPRADMKKIQGIYEQMHLTGKHPQNYITH